jgi:xylulokinase
VGHVTSPALAAAGVVDARTLVVTGGHDHPMAALAIRRVQPEAIIDSMGTAELLYGEMTESQPTPRNPYFAYSRPILGPGIACLGVLELSRILEPLLAEEDDSRTSLADVMRGEDVPGAPRQGPALRDVLEDCADQTRERLAALHVLGAPDGPLFATGGWARSPSLLRLGPASSGALSMPWRSRSSAPMAPPWWQPSGAAILLRIRSLGARSRRIRIGPQPITPAHRQ